MIADNLQTDDRGISGTCKVFMLVLFWVLITAPQLSATPDDRNIHKDSLGLGLPVSSDSSHLRYQVYGFLLARNTNEDLKASRRRFDGFGIGLQQGEVNFRPDRYTELFFRGSYDRLWSRNDRLQQQAFGQLQCNYLFRFAKNSTGHWYGGPYINVSAHFRIYEDLANNSEQWDVLGNVGLALRYFYPERTSGFLHRWQFSHQINVSLLGYLNRPHYSFTNYDYEEYWGVPGQINRLEFSTGILLPVGKDMDNLYRLEYSWQMLQHRQNEVQHLLLARHSLSFCFLFLSKKSTP